MHAQKLVEKAQEAADRRAWDHAIEFFTQALQLDPDHLEGREGLRKAELAKAEAYYPSKVSRYLSTIGNRIAVWLAGIMKNHEKVMVGCERILAKDPKNVAAGLRLHQAAVAAGHTNASLAACRGVLMVDNRNLDAWMGAGVALARLGESAKALEAFEKAIEIEPRDQEANRMRKNLAAEVSIGATGIDRSGHSRDVLRDKGQVEELEKGQRIVRSTEELEESAKSLEAEVEKNPNDPILLKELAARYTALRQFDKAIETYERAYKLQPTNFDLREKAGDLRIQRFDRAIRAAKNADDGTKAERIHNERLAFVVQEYRQRVQDHPTDLVLHFQLGKSLYEIGDLDGAIAEFQMTNRDPRRKIESLTMLGNCFIAKGMFDLAENQLRKAMEETPGFSARSKDILYALGQLKEKQGKPREALDEYKLIYEADIGYKDVAARMEAIRKEMTGE